MLSGHWMIVLGAWVLRVAALILLWGAWRLLRRAHEAGLDPLHLAWLGPLALLLGWVKAQRAVRPVLARNVAWLRGQSLVPAWRVYQPWLMGMIVGMIALSQMLKSTAAGRPLPLALLGALDLAVGTALMCSLTEFGSPFQARRR